MYLLMLTKYSRVMPETGEQTITTRKKAADLGLMEQPTTGSDIVLVVDRQALEP